MTRPEPHWVYRCYDADNRLLYVGCTADVEERLAAHRRGEKAASRWLAVCMDRYEVSHTYENRSVARRAESAAIVAEQPLFNTRDRNASVRETRTAVARYLVARGLRELAIETACTCWPGSAEVGVYDEWCVAHADAREALTSSTAPIVFDAPTLAGALAVLLNRRQRIGVAA